MATPPIGSFFHVRGIETSPGGQCIIHQPHRHPNLYQIVWITGGYGTIRIDTCEFDLESRAFFLLSPGCVHTCERAGRFRGVVIHFTADYLHLSSAENSTKVSFANRVLSRLSDEEVTVLEEIITAIEQEFADRQGESYSIIYHRLNTIIAYLSRWYGTTPPCGSQLEKSVLARFEALVEQQYRSQRQVSTYAEQLHLTADHLSETVRRLTGKTAG